MRAIRASFDWLQDHCLSGVWRVLRGYGVRLRSAAVQQWSPDPDYIIQEMYLHQCLREAAAAPGRVALVFLDEMGYSRWPDPAADWTAQAPNPRPVADRAASRNRLWRMIGALNALTGQVHYRDGYIVGREKVNEFYEQLDRAYPDAQRLLVVQDNWSIHRHPEVEAAVAQWPRIERVWLPTYAPWLNPIEKLWRWLRQDVLKLHRLAGDWAALRGRVHAFLDQFAAGSQQLLQYVGLLGEGRLVQAPRGP